MQDIIEKNNNVIKPVFINYPYCIEYALNLICDYDSETKTFCQNLKKSYKYLALSLLHLKENFFLKEFIAALSEAA